VVVATNKSDKQGMPLAVLYRNELMKHPQVLNASVSVYSFVETPWVQLRYPDEKKNNQTVQYNAIDANFVPAMGIKLINGRNFGADNTADITGSVLVNEAYIKYFNLTDPIGKKLPGPFRQHIIGIVKDFHFQSLHTKIQPLIMTAETANADSLINTFNALYDAPLQPHISIQLKAGNISDNINMLKQAWAAVAPGEGFDYKFLDETIAAQYKQEQRTNMIVRIASGLSIFIACMGLFGLATLTVVKRIKEIGIRKVLGANIGSIVKLLSVDFVKLVLIAAIIASPIAWWAMNKWLQDFNYRVDIDWWVFILAGLAAILIALATVSYHAIKAALVNPVKSLKTE
jgi:putative ABC transport system permease protein